MSQSPRDANSVPAGLGVSDADSVTVLPFYIDSVTGRVLFNITESSDAGGITASAPALREGNRVTTTMATYSDDTGIAPVVIDSRNGNLYLDMLFV